MSTAREKLEAKIAAQSDQRLTESVILMYAVDHSGLEPDDRQARCLVRTAIADELVRRHPAADDVLEQWFSDESQDGLEFITAHTYGELVALAVTEVTKAQAS